MKTVQSPLCACIKKNLGRILLGDQPVGLQTGRNEEENLLWHICTEHTQMMLHNGTEWSWTARKDEVEPYGAHP